MLRAAVTSHEDDFTPLLVDTSRQFPLFLEESTWKKAGVDVHSLTPVAGATGNVRQGTVPMFRLGGFDLPNLPAVSGIDLKEITEGIDISLGGIVGADLLAFFRLTFADEGRFMWVEPDPSLMVPAVAAPSPAASPPGATAPVQTPPSRSGSSPSAAPSAHRSLGTP